MLSPPPINTLPIGLLSLLGIKNGGVNPQYLLPQLAPVLDLSAFYLQQKAELLAPADQVVNAVGSFLGGAVVVPAGEMWVVHSSVLISAAVLGAGAVLQAGVAFFTDQSAGVRVAPQVLAGAGDSFLAGFEGPILLPSGYKIGIQATRYTAPAATISQRIYISRLSF